MASSKDVHKEPRPPDDASQQSKVSFRDKLIGKNGESAQRERVDLIENNLFRIELEEGKATTKVPVEAPSKKAPDQSKVTIGKSTNEKLTNEEVIFKSKSVVATETPSKNPFDQHKDSVFKSSNENEGIIFKSEKTASSSKNNSRKKRHRSDSSFKPSQSVLSNVSSLPPKHVLNNSDSKSDHGEKSGHDIPPHGIKTIFYVDILSANKMRFRDEDDPDEDLVVAEEDDKKQENMDDKQDVDMHEDDSNLSSKDGNSNLQC
ncbi:hypothetical protein SESBI_34009 [Sesbania bispinosa]|nr:hypothetical protein SESBI_34009 [Sesbania bispinosa]